MTITDSPVDNAVNVAALLGAREALSAAPEGAQFTWRASCTWRNGTHSHSTVSGFAGLPKRSRSTCRTPAAMKWELALRHSRLHGAARGVRRRTDHLSLVTGARDS
jgi:hypothetical protein